MYRRKIESEHRGTDPLCDDCDALCRASNLRSLREVCLGFAANATRMNHLGIDHMICRTTLSDANKRRKSSFFGSIYRMLYSRYAPFLSDSNNTEYRNTVF